jgi:hypothetical protein
LCSLATWEPLSRYFWGRNPSSLSLPLAASITLEGPAPTGQTESQFPHRVQENILSEREGEGLRSPLRRWAHRATLPLGVLDSTPQHSREGHWVRQRPQAVLELRQALILVESSSSLIPPSTTSP